VEVFRAAVSLMVRSMVLSAQSAGQQRLLLLQRAIVTGDQAGELALSPRKMLSEPSESFFSPRRPGILVGMKVTLSFLRSLCRCLGVLLQLLRYALRFCWALVLPRAVTAAQLLAIESQLAAELNRASGRRKRHHAFSPAFRILWVMLSKFLDGWEQLVHVMKPETVKRWHTRAFRAWWRWKSRPGRNPVAPELQQLIRRLSKENPLWGAERIREVLLLMGYQAPGEDTVRKYMVKPRKPRPATTCPPEKCYPSLLRVSFRLGALVSW